MAGITMLLAALAAINGVQSIGVYPITETPYPHQASIRKFGTHVCSGSIIDKQHILTAAHCVVSILGSIADDTTVFTGTNNLVPGQGKGHKVFKVFVHENFKFKLGEKSDDDVAILRLTEEIVFDEHQKSVSLPKSKSSANEKATVSGWNFFDYPVVIGTSIQLPSDVEVLSTSSCSSNYSEFDADKQLCGIYQQQVDHCTTDSASGLVDSNGVLIGFTSRLASCDNTKPGLFVKVLSYVDWIQEKVQV